MKVGEGQREQPAGEVQAKGLHGEVAHRREVEAEPAGDVLRIPSRVGEEDGRGDVVSLDAADVARRLAPPQGEGGDNKPTQYRAASCVPHMLSRLTARWAPPGRRCCEARSESRHRAMLQETRFPAVLP